jgi:catechol 2,3-dioxygenase-like lactoylglutathione lyase family enzyme
MHEKAVDNRMAAVAMPKITGAHTIIYSRDAEADRAFLRDVVGLPFVDAGHGWLIFALPPAEVAVHPADAGEAHELYLMVDDVDEFISSMAARGVACSPPRDLRWGFLTQVQLPSGGKLGVYQPRHARPMSQKQAGQRRLAGPGKKSARQISRRTKG